MKINFKEFRRNCPDRFDKNSLPNKCKQMVTEDCKSPAYRICSEKNCSLFYTLKCSAGHKVTSREQQLVDICFELVLTSVNHIWFKDKKIEEVANWVAEKLRDSGFDTQPMGSSWGVLKK